MQYGYAVYNLDIKDNSSLKEYPNYTYLATDVSGETAIVKSLDVISKAVDKVEVVIVSAGKHLSANIENTTSKQLSELVSINLFGAFWLIQHVLPLMREQGSIITIGSDQYQIAKPNSAVYGMTKAALAHLTKSTALDYPKVRVNCIGAGTIDTPLYRAAIENYALKSGIPLSQIEEDENAQQPIGRVGNPDEVAELAYFLAGDGSHYLTGAYIPLDGGYTIR